MIIYLNKQSNSVKRKFDCRYANSKLDTQIATQLDTGKLYARISSRPGQCGHADVKKKKRNNLIFHSKVFSILFQFCWY